MEEKIINITNEAIENSIIPEKENVTFGGNTNYEELTNKPQINNVELIGNKTFEDLGFYSIFIESGEIRKIVVVDTLPEIEEEGILYLVKEQAIKENLYYQNEKKEYTSSSGITYIFDIDNTITLKGTPNKDASTYSNNFNVNLDTNKNYKLKLNYLSGNVTKNAEFEWKVYLYYNNEEPDHQELCSGEFTNKNNLELSFKPTLTGNNIYGIRVYVYGNNVYDNLKYSINIEEV